MGLLIDPGKNYEKTKKEIGYVCFKEATEDDYKRIGFKSGLEVHQQLKTKEKLFCRCPNGKYQSDSDYDAEVIRHMRPTLSELGEYDGTALMEFKTRKEIIYLLNNDSACTYDIDDTPPFKIDKEALEIALRISLLCKLNIVGEVHITRKQYLDGSIPAGFQRTAILGVEGEIPLKNKKVRLIQLSIEEDSCREISDVGHTRVYKTDRLGIPLIETVTYPDMTTPQEVKEAAEYIRFLNRSTGKVRTGIGTGREDVNVSCKGGTRVEIKGVSHNSWIPHLTHNECFRQWALLNIRKKLNAKINGNKNWKIQHTELDPARFTNDYLPLNEALKTSHKIIAVNLPHFAGILSHFTQPGKTFANELCDRLKVVACLEKPNLIHSEQIENRLTKENREIINLLLNCTEEDAQIVFWSTDSDIETALETIEERCLMAFEGVPQETRKSFENGTTIFERVLPGADRMYPDTDSAPIPLDLNYIEKLSHDLPVDVIDRMNQLKAWDVPEDTFTYLLKKNLIPLIEKIHTDLEVDPKFLCILFGQRFKFIEGHSENSEFNTQKVYDLFAFLKEQELKPDIAHVMLPVIYEHPLMDFESVLTTIHFKKKTKEEIVAPVNFLKEKFKETCSGYTMENETNWVMGQIRKHAIGNMNLKELYTIISEQ